MDTIIKIIEIFAFLTGLLYIVLEILQKNIMWYVGIVTASACAFSFGVQQLYALMGLNIYYVFISFWGVYQWRKVKAGQDNSYKEDDSIRLNKINAKVFMFSSLAFILMTILLIWMLNYVGDSATALDAVVTVLSVIATYWLAKLYIQQWSLWILADTLSCILCIVSGLYWMAALSMFYAMSAAYGYYYWNKNGTYIQ